MVQVEKHESTHLLVFNKEDFVAIPTKNRL